MTCQEAVDWMGEALEDVLEPAVRSGFEGHMAECSPCATYFEHLRISCEALHHLPREPLTSPHRERLIAEFRREFGRLDG